MSEEAELGKAKLHVMRGHIVCQERQYCMPEVCQERQYYNDSTIHNTGVQYHGAWYYKLRVTYTVLVSNTMVAVQQ